MSDEHLSDESPSSYITQLKSQYPPKSSEPVNISEPLLSLHGGDEAKVKDVVKTIRSQDYAKSLLSRLRPGLPDFFFDLLEEDIIAVGEINDPIPNAKAVRLDGPTYAVLFNSGLTRFLYRVTRAISTRFSLPGEQSDHESVSFDETCRIVTDIFFWYVETGQAFGPSYPITRQQMTIASMIATEAESFFLAHEIGHIYNEIKAIAEKQHAEAIDSAWKDELAADEFALDALLASRNSETSPVPLEICYAGAEIAVSVFAGLEAVGVKFEDSHPPASERLALLRKKLRSRCADEESYEQVIALARPLDLVFKKIIEKLASPDWQAFLDRAAQEVVAQLDEQLDRCTDGMVPDYSSFHRSMPAIFERISSYRLYERVAKAAADFFGHMDRINSEGQAGVNQESWIAFQKYKLFMSSIRELSEPARSLLEEALEIET